MFDLGHALISHLYYLIRAIILTALFPDEQTDDVTAQPYRVLARKYRPNNFAEMIGQESMVRTLTNAIHSGRLPQAWMLTGVRGIGKTTTARLVAKALNCTGRAEDDKSIEPCGKCDACVSIADDRHVDVQEMDAASRTGVDDIREIVESVRYGPVSAKYKIYILDEVHMLSKNAFNALLKTLEEPPPHTKFIFATTEIRKVPVTVLSRCQRFDLRRIESHELAAHYTNIVQKEEATSEEAAIELIAHAADGSVRDGLSLLDQAIALGDGHVKEDDVKAMLGHADRAASLVLCRQILRGEMVDALASYGTMVQSGCDPLQTLQDMAELIHRLTRAQIITDGSLFKGLPEAEKDFTTDLADIKIPALTRAWQILLKGITEVQMAAQPIIATEMVLIRLAYAAELPNPSDLIKKLREQKSSDTGATQSPPSGGGGTISRFGNVETVAVAQAAPVVQQSIAVAPSAMPTSFRDLVELFAQHHEGTLYAEMASYVHLVRMSAGKLEIRVEKQASKTLVPMATQCLQKWTGERWMIAMVDEEGEPTLAEEDDKKERLRYEKAESHPLMKAVRETFPEAKLVSLKQKPQLVVVDDDANIIDDDSASDDD